MEFKSNLKGNFDMNDADNEACGLELKGGLNGVKYKQDFVKAPKSQHPSPAPSSGKEVPKNDEAMRMSLGC
jgi:hypothetical protein